MKKLQIKCEDAAAVQAAINKLKETNPDYEIWIIKSRGMYYIEDEDPFVRSFEVKVFSGKAKNFTHCKY